MKRDPLHKPLVAVIGGGISGLSVAFWLLQNGMETIVLEEGSRPGGIIRSERADGYLIDHAANCLLNFLPEVNTLCDTVNVRKAQIYRSKGARRRYLLKNGHPTHMPEGLLEFLGTDLWSLKGKLRLILEPLIPRARTDEDETVAQFIIRRFGHETLEQIVEPFIGGSYAGDPFQLSVKSTFPILHTMENRYGSVMIGALIKRLKGSKATCPTHLFSFSHGMETLPRAISHYLGERFVPGSRVMGIEHRVDKTWDIITEKDGTSTIYNSDAVVIATPSYEAARLINSLDAGTSDMLKGIKYSPVVVVYTGFKRDSVKHPLDGIGCMIPSGKGYSILGTLWNSTLFTDRAPEGMVAFTNYLGGRRNPEMIDKADEKFMDATIRDLDKIVGINSPPSFVRIIRHKRAIPQYTTGHQGILKTVESTPGRIPGLFIAGNYLRGISVRDCISYGARLGAYLKNNGFNAKA
jgi:oxygen-dependent protoporphyrinogen oxidase